MREYFCAYHSMLDATRKLSDAEVGRLFRALLMYSSGEQPTDLKGREELLFDVFAQQIDKEIQAYDEMCKRNSINRRTPNKKSRTVTTGDNSSRLVTTRDDPSKDDIPENPFGYIEDDSIPNTVVSYITSNLDRLSPIDLQEVIEIKDRLSDELIRYAVDKTLEHHARSWKYTRVILYDFMDRGIKTLDDLKANEADKASSNKPPQPQDYNPLLSAKFY